MSSKRHVYGFCICKHVAPHWNRPRHWTEEEVTYLEQSFGRVPDDRIAKHLGRSVLGVRLKAKRLVIRKRNIGMTARSVAEIFDVDAKTVTGWLTKGVLKGSRGYAVGPNQTWLVSEEAVERFICEHGHYIDVDHMPDSWYRDLAAKHRWYSVAEVEARVGQSAHLLLPALKAGEYRGARRGSHWYVAAEELPRIADATDVWRRQHIPILQRERAERLRRRRDKRKGIGRFRQAA